MSAPLVAHGVEKTFGDRRILRGCDLIVQKGDRVGLVGANGCGKSTFLSILAGAQLPDFGTVERRGTITLLEQDPELPGLTVGDAADDGIAWHHQLLNDYEAALSRGELREAEVMQARLDARGWTLEHEVDTLLDRLGAPPRDLAISALSGGERRRVALVRALLGDPDVLLLDEPTNHLDSDTTEWLQEWMAASKATIVLVTHDRYLLEAVATRIVEVDDGVCVNYEGSYADYLVERAERQARLERDEDSRLAFLAREAEWASRSPAARSTKQKARLDRLEVLSRTRPVKREETFELDLSTGEKAGKMIFELRNLGKGYGGRTLFAGLDLALAPKERLGILGANGCGKSTLLRILGGREHPDVGDVVLASRVRVATLDQERSGLTNTDTVFEAAGNGASHVTLGGRQVHVAGFLKRFLFPREVLDQRVSSLSGGERARLLLAKLLLAGSTLLLLDEPTNDLDLQTLRVLEEALMSFDGAVVVVTHDRAFLDRVCTTVLAFEDDGLCRYASRQQHVAAMARKRSAAARDRAAGREVRVAAPPPLVLDSGPKRLSFQEGKELAGLPARIEASEARKSAAELVLADPALYRGNADRLATATAALALEVSGLAALYARWEELEARVHV